ncbi:MAG: membrane protein [Candidatus Binatia bacterium]|nr:MAG: membrane protein [Candidatus Binatia bacterium]
MDLEPFLARNGPTLIYLGCVVEGDTVMLVAGGLAHYGVVSPLAAWLAGALGAFTADTFFYWIGRWGAHMPWLRRFAPMHRATGRWGPFEIVLARLVPGARVASMLYWGMNRLSYGWFGMFDLLACPLWSAVFALVGFVFASQLSRLLPMLLRLEHRLLMLAIAGLSVLVLIRRVRHYWNSKH